MRKQKNKKEQKKEKKIDIDIDVDNAIEISLLDEKIVNNVEMSDKGHDDIIEVEEGSAQDIVPVIGIARRLAMQTAWHAMRVCLFD